MIKKVKTKKIDVAKKGKTGWQYSEAVKNHFFHPKNVLLKDPKPGEYDAEAVIGAPVCGDVMRMWVKIDKKTEKIKKLKWRTFGCATAIASTSVFSEMITENGGLKIEEALKIKPDDIVKKLGGVPDRKIHCSVLADQAFKEAIKNYKEKHGK
ncbi:MAG: iron-sulfur cluster assembly scaffold protein [Candidatus Pacebacteria bacterium]|nr:iron-sulfur cluster assembly scaffold protein [Candidatus Paceibacterota bacterium]